MNCRIAKISLAVLRPAVKPGCSLRRWLWKLGLMLSKRIIGDGFLDPYNVDYVDQPLNHRVPAFFEQLCSDGADARG